MSFWAKKSLIPKGISGKFDFIAEIGVKRAQKYGKIQNSRLSLSRISSFPQRERSEGVVLSTCAKHGHVVQSTNCYIRVGTKNALNRSIFDHFKLSFFLNWSEFNQRSIPTNDMLPACLVVKLRIFLCMGLICEILIF